MDLFHSIKKQSFKKKLGKMITYIFLIIGSIITIFPFVWLVRSSLMDVGQIFVFPPEWIPKPVMWTNYIEALTSVPFGLYFLNTMKILIGVLVGVLFTASLSAFSFARLRWPGRDTVFKILLSTLMLPYMVGLIPKFILWKNLGFIDTFVPLTAPAWFGGGIFYIFLLRQFFLRIPRSYDEAAYVDGATPWQVYWKIMIPLAKPSLIAISIFEFRRVWNDLLGPIIYLTDPAKYTLAIGLAEFKGMFSAQWNLLMAAAVVVVTPVIILFFVGQKYFIKGITLSGVKG